MRFLFCKKGQGVVEYGLILALVAIVVISILAILGPAVGNVFSRATEALQNPPGSSGGDPDPGGSSFGSGWLFVMLTVTALTYSISGRKRPRMRAV